jgi:hypothetical protein
MYLESLFGRSKGKLNMTKKGSGQEAGGMPSSSAHDSKE